MEFDYAEELLSNPDNIELKIERRRSAESVTRENHPNTFDKSPSSVDIVPQTESEVNPTFSISDSDGNQLTEERPEYFKDSKVRDENATFSDINEAIADGRLLDITKKGEQLLAGRRGSNPQAAIQETVL